MSRLLCKCFMSMQTNERSDSEITLVFYDPPPPAMPCLHNGAQLLDSDISLYDVMTRNTVVTTSRAYPGYNVQVRAQESMRDNPGILNKRPGHFRISSNHLTRSLRLSHAFFAIVCCGMYLWIHNTIQSQFGIQAETNPSILDQARVVREQQKKIEYMVAQPKIIFRCPDDEPKIKYPRQASDDLTRISIGTVDECSNTTDLDALIIVHTSADHFKRRDRFRRTYANYNNTKPFRLKLVFLIGQVENADLGIKLEKENMEHRDTVMGSFLDTYQNLTLKAVMGFRWVSSTCSDIKLLIKMDDDVFFDVRKFFTRYWNRIGGSLKSKAIHCQFWEHAKVGRTGKWKVERGLFSNSSYPFPYCAGFFVIVTPDLVRSMYEVGKSIEFFWIDDVFLYGMVPATIKNVHFAQVGRWKKMVTESYRDWKNCMKRKGQAGCTYWAVLTNGEDEFDSEYDSFFALRPAIEVAGNKTLVISV